MDQMMELKRTLEAANRYEGMSQYILMVYSEDIIISPDMIVLTLLNSTYHGLDILDLNMALNEAQSALEANLDQSIVGVVIQGNKVRFKPKVVNEYEDTQSFVLMAKTGNKFILKDVYKKYLSNASIGALITDLYLNTNSSSILTTDSNYLVYDDSIPFVREILTTFINGNHKERLIPISKVADFMVKMSTERETVFDFITSNIDDVMVNLNNEVYNLIKEKDISDDVVNNMKICSLIGNINMNNVKQMDDMKEGPGYNVGLTNLFKRDLLDKR